VHADFGGQVHNWARLGMHFMCAVMRFVAVCAATATATASKHNAQEACADTRQANLL
jgi:hypothetical protein